MGVAYRTWRRSRSISTATSSARPSSRWREALGGALDDDQVREAVDRQYRATIDAAELRADCLDVAAVVCATADVHVQIVSNIDDEQLERTGAEARAGGAIDAATSSEAARSCKPDPGIYEFALGQAGCAPAEVLFVGDSPRHDIAGPQALGMATALLVTDGRPTPADCVARTT